MTSATKAQLRQQFIPRRRGADRGAPAQIARRLSALLPQRAVPTQSFILASYLPIRGEWDPWPVIAALEAQQGAPIVTAIPLTPAQPGPLCFKRWRPGKPTAVGRFDTREPTADAGDVALDQLVFLVPGVAIDRHGIRLGYGGGFYDRTFAQLGKRLKRSRLIGFMLDAQVSDMALPREPTDVALGAAITPTRTLHFD